MLKISFLLLVSLTSFAAEKPKYGPEATPITRSHEYLRQSEAPDYWALSPYYLPQKTGSACSSASVAIVLNGLRVEKSLPSDEPLVTEAGMLKKTANAEWADRVGQGTGLLAKMKQRGVTLELLGKYVEGALKVYEIAGAKVEVVHQKDASEESVKKLRAALNENERSSRDFIIVNMNQGILTGDPEGGGHVSPIAAYDAKADRVLVLDVDREWYEPYWVSVKTLAAAMATSDKESGQSRGYVWIRR